MSIMSSVIDTDLCKRVSVRVCIVSWTCTHYLQFLQKVSTQRRFKQLFSILIRLYDLQLNLWGAGFLQHPTRGVGQGMGGLSRGGTIHKGGGRTGGRQV